MNLTNYRPHHIRQNYCCYSYWQFKGYVHIFLVRLNRSVFTYPFAQHIERVPGHCNHWSCPYWLLSDCILAPTLQEIGATSTVPVLCKNAFQSSAEAYLRLCKCSPNQVGIIQSYCLFRTKLNLREDELPCERGWSCTRDAELLLRENIAPPQVKT